MEEDVNNNIVQDDETNELIQDLFTRLDADEDIDDILDIPLLDKANTPLYDGSIVNLLSTTLLLVNLIFLNCLSNMCMT